MDHYSSSPESRRPQGTESQQTAQQRRAERLKYAKRQRNIRMGAIALAIVLSIVSLCVSCSTKKAVDDLAAKIEAKKAAQAALAAQEAAPSDSPAPSQLPANAKTVTLSFVGNLTLSSTDGSFEEAYGKYGESYFFQNVRSIFEGDDLTIANLEGTLTTSENQADKDVTFKADPSYVSILTQGGINCISVAGDHTLDYGNEGYVDTLAALDNAGIQRFGDSYTATVDVKGVKIGLSGINACDTGLESQTLAVSNVKTLKDGGAQIVICAFHWGSDDATTPDDTQLQLAKAVIDAGADLVVGSHPHGLQGISAYKGKYICYSLGDFCSGSITENQDTMIFQQTFTLVNDAVQSDADYTIIPCTVSPSTAASPYCPTPATGAEAQRILSAIYDQSAALDGGIAAPDTENQDTQASALEANPSPSA